MRPVLGAVGLGHHRPAARRDRPLIYNTIRLTVFARRSEIHIMQLVGATRWTDALAVRLRGHAHRGHGRGDRHRAVGARVSHVRAEDRDRSAVLATQFCGRAGRGHCLRTRCRGRARRHAGEHALGEPVPAVRPDAPRSWVCAAMLHRGLHVACSLGHRPGRADDASRRRRPMPITIKIKQSQQKIEHIKQQLEQARGQLHQARFKVQNISGQLHETNGAISRVTGEIGDLSGAIDVTERRLPCDASNLPTSRQASSAIPMRSTSGLSTSTSKARPPTSTCCSTRRRSRISWSGLTSCVHRALGHRAHRRVNAEQHRYQALVADLEKTQADLDAQRVGPRTRSRPALGFGGPAPRAALRRDVATKRHPAARATARRSHRRARGELQKLIVERQREEAAAACALALAAHSSAPRRSDRRGPSAAERDDGVRAISFGPRKDPLFHPSACAGIRSWAATGCTPASTSQRLTARRSSPQTTASCCSSAGMAATATPSSSTTAVASRPCTLTVRRFWCPGHQRAEGTSDRARRRHGLRDRPAPAFRDPRQRRARQSSEPLVAVEFIRPAERNGRLDGKSHQVLCNF